MEDERRINDGRIDRILAHLEQAEKRDTERFICPDIASLEKLLDLKMGPMGELLHEIKTTVYGKNGNPPGLTTRVDRVEQANKMRNWVLGGLSAPVLAGLGMKIWEWIKHP